MRTEERMKQMKERYGYEIQQQSKLTGRDWIAYTLDGIDDLHIIARARTMANLEKKLKSLSG